MTASEMTQRELLGMLTTIVMALEAQGEKEYAGLVTGIVVTYSVRRMNDKVRPKINQFVDSYLLEDEITTEMIQNLGGV